MPCFAALVLLDATRFLLVRMENASKAEGILEAALKMDEDCEIAMFNLAVLLHRYKFDLDAAEQMLRRLLKKAPQHSAGTLQMARLLSEKYSKKQAVGSGEQQSAQMIILFDDMCSFYERALPLLTEVRAESAATFESPRASCAAFVWVSFLVFLFHIIFLRHVESTRVRVCLMAGVHDGWCA